MIDCHTHTSNSPDAKNTVPELCEQAIALGLDALAITEHCEVNRYYGIEHYDATPNGYDTYHFDLDFEKSMKDNTLAKQKYHDKLNLISGIELGQATHDFELAEKIITDERLDFVIGSMHQLPNYDDFAFIDYNEVDIPSLLLENYLEVLKLCKWGKFDVLGHLTYTLRYIVGNYGIDVDMKPYEEIIAECFKVLINKGKGIEINTSGLRQTYGRTFPDFNYIKLYKDLGGEILTIGSDSHSTYDLARGIPEGIELARLAGFVSTCYFKKRKPYFVNL
ncbi:MAG: histidinol-phosphatase HisJ family protein [Clostridiales bacterium]|nr:histidinol-phosphatase HisJ family protein [Clostridiales bacterium]